MPVVTDVHAARRLLWACRLSIQPGVYFPLGAEARKIAIAPEALGRVRADVVTRGCYRKALLLSDACQRGSTDGGSVGGSGYRDLVDQPVRRTNVSVTNAFKTFQDIVNAVITYVREARARRDLFKGVFGAEDDVKEVVASGSLARGTHKDPIHDVDLIVVYDQDEHPEWGTPGSSAADALDYTRERVNALLGATNGTYEKTVRLARWRNHAVKCFLDDPDDPDAFTVDAMPALRRDGKLLIPEALAEDWVPCDPEFLIAEVADRHAEWNKFAGTVRMLKWWAAEQDTKIKSSTHRNATMQ